MLCFRRRSAKQKVVVACLNEMVPSRVLRISPIVVSQPSCTGGAKRCRRLFQWDPNSADDDDFYPDDDTLVGETTSAMATNFPLAFHGAAIL